jgi:hypothetical protein
MTKSMRTASCALVALLSVLVFSCKEINRQSAPVELILSTDQTLQTIDILGGNGCNQSIGTVSIKAILLQTGNANLPLDTRFDDVQLDRYEVTYVRTDGGTLIPQPFVRAMSDLITTGGGATSTPFIAFPPGAFSQAPFAALLPVNGGRDPETGKNYVQMELVLTVFGQTLAGERVSGSTRVPLNFCANCNGCS